jgi:dipeptidyl-peptidase-3
LEKTSDGNVLINLDRSKILSHGQVALRHFLRELQLHKSTAHEKEGREFFGKYSEMTKDFEEYRSIVLKRKPNRTQWIQPNTVLEKDEVHLREYPATKEGLIMSWAERSV